MVRKNDLRSGGRGGGRAGGRNLPAVPYVAEEGQDGFMEDITQEEQEGADGAVTPGTGAGAGGGVPPGNTEAAPDIGNGAQILDANGVLLVNVIPGIVTALQQLAHVQNGILATQTGLLIERQTAVAPHPPPAPCFVAGAKQFRSWARHTSMGQEVPWLQRNG